MTAGRPHSAAPGRTMLLTLQGHRSGWFPASVATPQTRGQGEPLVGQSGAAPHGAKVQAGGDGAGGGVAEAVTRARRLTGRGFKQAATAAVGTGQSVGRGPQGARAQAGSEGGKGHRPVGRVQRPTGQGLKRAAKAVGGHRPVGRARRPAEYRFRPAATAAVGAGCRWSPGCRAPRGGGSSRQRRRRWGPAGRSGAAERAGRPGWAGAAGSPCPRRPGRRGRPPLKPLHLFDLGEYSG